MDRVECFFLEPSNVAEEAFRRYCSNLDEKCPGSKSYHDASVVIGEVALTADYHGCGSIPPAELRRDSRWPTTCGCGYTFKENDPWQHRMARYFVDRASGKRYTLADAPPGAMWNADWMHRFDRELPADGIWLCVRLPDGVDWLVDGPSNDAQGNHGPGWTRSGTVPKVTTRPSILTPGYHGFLTEGFLIKC